MQSYSCYIHTHLRARMHRRGAQFLFNFVIFFYGLYTGVSGTSMLDTWTTLSFSVIYTFAPVLVVGAPHPRTAFRAVLVCSDCDTNVHN